MTCGMSGEKLLRGGRVVDPSQDLDSELDVRIVDGQIAELGEGLSAEGAEIVELDGLVMAPGFIDPHVHLGEPGYEERETIASGLAAAAAGGFTAVACLADTQPVHDGRSVTELLVRQAERAADHQAEAVPRLYPIGALTRGRDGEELAEIGEMVAAGAVAFSDAERPLRSAALLRRALLHAQHYDVPVIDHPEDPDLAGEGVMHEGAWATRLGLPGIPALAEEIAVARDLLLAEETGGRLCLALLSTARSLEQVRKARERGVSVSCTVSLPHLLLADAEVGTSGFSTATKLRPPLRPAEDVEALVSGLADGTVDAMTSAHTPHHPDEKDVQFSIAPCGAVGLETTVSLCLDRLVRTGHVKLSRLIDLLSTGPARILGLPGGSLAPGRPADITFLDLEHPLAIQASAFRSKGRSTPFDGWALHGSPAGIMVSGKGSPSLA